MKTLTNAIDEFVKTYPTIKNPDLAFGMCAFYCDLFKRTYPEFRGRVLHVQGHRSVFSRRHANFPKYYKNPDPYFYHSLFVTHDKFVVDFTYRQLDRKGPYAPIFTMDEVKKEWLILSYNYEHIVLFGCIGSSLRQTEKSWQNRAYGRRLTREERQTLNSEKKAEAKKAYLSSKRLIRKGTLELTGTEEDNIFLYKLNNTYKAMFSGV